MKRSRGRTPVGARIAWRKESSPLFRPVGAVGAVPYAVLASLRIISTDIAVGYFRTGSMRDVLLNVSKGLFFVAVTPVALFLLIRSHLLRLRAATSRWRGSSACASSARSPRPSRMTSTTS